MAAFQDLTTARMIEFNRAVPDAGGVVYGSVVGIAPRRREVNPLLLPTYLWLGDRAGASDGSVHLVAGPGALGNGSAPAGGAVPGRTHSLGSMKAFGPGRD